MKLNLFRDTLNSRLCNTELALGYTELKDWPTPVAQTTLFSSGHGLKQSGKSLSSSENRLKERQKAQEERQQAQEKAELIYRDVAVKFILTAEKAHRHWQNGPPHIAGKQEAAAFFVLEGDKDQDTS